MQTLTAEQECGLQPEVTVLELWERALSEGTPEAREAAAWEVFQAAKPRTSPLPALQAYELPAEVRPLLIAACERARGRSPLDSLARLSLSSDGNVRNAVARALIRLSVSRGEWDRSAAREILAGLKAGGDRGFRQFIQDDYDELAPKNLNFSLLRLRGTEPDETVWSGSVGAAVLFLIGAVVVGIGVSLRNSTVFMIGFVFLIRILWVLWRPGEKGDARLTARRLALLKHIDEAADEDPEALRRALPELRVLSWRISDEPEEVREAAARLVQRIKATERDTRQLPIVSAQPSRQTEALPLPSEAGTGHE